MTQQVKRTSDSENPILTISAKNGWMDQKDRFNRVIAGKELKNYIELYKNELSYNHGNSKYAKFGIIYVQRKYEKALVPKVYHSFSMSYGDPRFIENLSVGHKLDKELSKLITSGARQDGLLNINKKSFYTIKLFTPSEQEQIKISNIIDVINHVITLYERKLKLLSQVKKYFLDNLFAKKEYPNLRFKGFTDAWEQRKLSSILIERKDLSTESKQFPLSSFIQEKGVVPKSQRYDRSFLVKDSSKKYKVTKFGDFIYSSNNLDTGSIGLNSYGNAVISPVYSVFSSKNSNILETNFVNLLFQQNFYKNKMLRFRQGVMYGQLKIKEDDFLKVKVNVPSQIEIKNIINLFSKIESYATLLENKKKQLVQIKNTLLNTMFI